MPSHLHMAIAENQRGHFEAALAHAETAIRMQQERAKPYLCAAFEFCGLPWTEAVLAFHETERAVRTASKHQVRRQLYESSVGRARRFPSLGAQLRDALGSAAGAELGENL
jgi:hypothetical protein